MVQLCIGCYHGTFGNLLPYLTSYMRQVKVNSFRMITLITLSLQSCPDLTHGDLAMIFSTGGLSQGVSYLLGESLL